ncbi:molybdenum cofactor guanylyltransferase [Paenibacillus sp. FSL H8-0537]|uniref:molybdenum cofactor guanylyltransferase n=1 Tax=Paenibacillus sp. FSL H8-0537 TaxID=2921399 RepID=UPI0031011F5C
MLTGAILAGGQSRRMGGRHKGLLPFVNESIVERQIRTMKQLCAEVILVTNDPRSYLPILGSSIRIITDYIPGKGPLSGMHAALTLATHSDIWVVGCDMPLISSAVAEQLWKVKRERRSAAAVPSMAGKLHPLHGVYDKRSAGEIEKLLDIKEYRVMTFLNRICYNGVDLQQLEAPAEQLSCVANVNTPEEYERIISLYDAALASQTSNA